MRKKTNILVAGRNGATCESVREILLGQPDLQVSMRVAEDLPGDPLQDLAVLPDLLIVVVGGEGEKMLATLGARASMQRPAMIIVGPGDDPQLMRRAMQAGARDFFVTPVPHDELLQAVRRISREQGDAVESFQAGPLTAVINAKGGSGASVVASNLAHISALNHRVPVALLDLDLQFGALPAAFDLEQRNSLLEALSAAEQLDPVALQGYMGKHQSQVHLLSAMSDELALPWEIPTDSLVRLLGVVRQAYAGTVVDLPRQIDPLTSIVLSQSTHVVVVMQQSLTHVRDAKRMMKVMTTSLGVPRNRILLVVNRHSETDPITLADIQETVNPAAMTSLPNDFQGVSESQNSGLPLAEVKPDGALTDAVRALVKLLDGSEEKKPQPASRKRSLREVLIGRGRS